jgi:hypothetical protein
MPLFIYDIPVMTSEQTIFKEAIALAALEASNTTGVFGWPTQHVGTSFGNE